MTRIFAFVLLSAALAPGQGPSTFPWWDTPLARDLNLSEEQHSRIRATVSEFRGRMIQARAAVETAEGDLRDAMQADPVDNRKANDLIEKLVTARAELMRAASQMSLKMRGILTAQQWRDLERRTPPPAGMRGPGGPPGGPGGPDHGKDGRKGRPGPPRPEE